MKHSLHAERTILHAGWKEVYENRFEDDDVTDDVKEQLYLALKKAIH